MKRLLLVLPLFCLAAGDAGIKDWRVMTGKWEETKHGLTSVGGHLFYTGKLNDSFRLKCFIRIAKWDETNEQRHVSIYWAWRWEGEGKGDWDDRHQLMIKPDHVLLAGPRGANMRKTDMTFPLNKRVLIELLVTPKAAKARIGRTQLEGMYMCGPIANLALAVNGADATFERVSVGTR